MKTTAFFLIILLSALSCFSQQRILLSGASFAVPKNGWFESGCQELGCIPINKAVSGESIIHTANKMFKGEFYSFEELEESDIFIIMHVHNQDVFEDSDIKDNYEDYEYGFNDNYAAAYDYVIKRYKSDCYNLKFNPESRYYSTDNGKPAKLILTTHWHDARTIYNSSVRKLTEKWNLPLIEWDINIGFTKDIPDEDGNQISLIYSSDTEIIDGVLYGWHPKSGKDEYIQRKISDIFVEELWQEIGATSIEKYIQEKDKQVAVYPNPFTDYIMVKGNETAFVSIASSDGKLVYIGQKWLEEYSIDTSNYPKGNYILTIRDKDNKTRTFKILK